MNTSKKITKKYNNWISNKLANSNKKNNPDLVLKSFPKIKPSVQFEANKKNKTKNTLNKIQKEKIDLLINRVYD